MVSEKSETNEVSILFGLVVIEKKNNAISSSYKWSGLEFCHGAMIEYAFCLLHCMQ